MGQGSSSDSNSVPLDRLTQAFAKDQCILEDVVKYKQGLAATAITPASNYVDYEMDASETARRILSREGPKKRIIYVHGSPFEMGYTMGRLLPDQIESLCTTYIQHIAPSFISEAFDMAMVVAPLFYQTAYELILSVLTDLLIEGSNRAFWTSYKQGDIPKRYLEEMNGLVEGVRSTNLFTPVTLDRVIAANYGLDYMIALAFSGTLILRLQKEWQMLPEDLRAQVPFKSEFIAAPDMCNSFMASKGATVDRKVFLMRDFQFGNAHVYHRNCTIIIRHPTEPGRMTHVGVGMPGLLGYVTFLNAPGVAFGINLVHTGAVDLDRIGLGFMFMMREQAESAHNIHESEQILKSFYRGAPWIYYGVDKQGDMKVFETVSSKWSVDKINAQQWVSSKLILLPSQKHMEKWYDPKFVQGVWARTGTPKIRDADHELRKWSAPMFEHFESTEVTQSERWIPGGFLFRSWDDERDIVNKISNHYFPPWRTIGSDVVVATNSFLNPLLRLTQMHWVSTITQKSGLGCQWRYDTMVDLIKRSYGKLDYETCRNIITFLSPWKQPTYPQNARPYRQAVPDVFAQQYATTGVKLIEPAVIIAGSISLVNVTDMKLENQSGYWGNDFYSVTLTNYLWDEVKPVDPNPPAPR